MSTLSPDQQDAADTFMEFLLTEGAGEMAIEGHAGTGKSYLTKHLLEAARGAKDLLKLLTNVDDGVRIRLTATTNKAAAVLQELAGEPAQTIHSMLKIKVFNDVRKGVTKLNKTSDYKVVKNTLIIIDEASMIDYQLLEMIRESTEECKVLYILDSYQLAPVKQRTCPVSIEVTNKVKLTTIQRQLEDSHIIQLAEGYRKVLDGNNFPPVTTDGISVQHVDGPTFQLMVESAFNNLFHSHNKYKVLAWTNDRVYEYNKHIRGLHIDTDKWVRGEHVITNKPILGNGTTTKMIPTDTVVRIDGISEYPVEHFDIDSWEIQLCGRFGYIPVDNNDLKELIKKNTEIAKEKGDWQNYFRIKDGFLDLRPIHASTVHKSQGSTYDTVFIDLTDIGRNNIRSETARLLYVAITRAANKVVLYGNLPTKYGG